MTPYANRYKAFDKTGLIRQQHAVYTMIDFNRFPILLAPMAGITDLPFRELSAELGADFTYTEMVSAKGLFYDSKNTRGLLALSDLETPCGIQLFGSDPEIMAAMAKAVCSEYHGRIALIDLNMGCPAHKIVKNGEGCALMRRPLLAARIIDSVKRAADVPITVKFRKGWDSDSINAVEFAKMAEQSGAYALTIHGRTREQLYSGKADWDIIASVKSAVNIPVIGNGDVFCAQDALTMRETTGCDGIMVARGALGNPFIFKEIKSGLLKRPYTPPTPEERIHVAIRHAKRHVGIKGERSIIQLRKHIVWYIKGMRGASELRKLVNACSSIEELERVLLSCVAS